MLPFTSVLANAQVPNLTGASNNPVVNDSFINIICNPAGVSVGAAGASISWNFATLSPTTVTYPIDTGHVITANASAPGYSLLSLVPGFSATHAIVTPASTVTNYYQASSSKLSASATYMDMNNNAVYTDPIDIFHYPFTFGSHFVDAYAGAVTYMGATITETGNVTVDGDGWGTLTLPPTPPSSSPTTYTGVLRVHSNRLFKDSLNLFGSTPVVDTFDSYTWYQPGYHAALLTITTVKGPGINNTVVSYAQKQIANHVAVPVASNMNASLLVYPNPTNDKLDIQFGNSTNESTRVSLTDMAGREVAVIADQATGAQHIICNVGHLAKGIYVLRLQSGSETVTRKIEIQ